MSIFGGKKKEIEKLRNRIDNLKSKLDDRQREIQKLQDENDFLRNELAYANNGCHQNGNNVLSSAFDSEKYTMQMPKLILQPVMDKLNADNIPFSAAERSGSITAVTVSFENSPFLNAAIEKSCREYVARIAERSETVNGSNLKEIRDCQNQLTMQADGQSKNTVKQRVRKKAESPNSSLYETNLASCMLRYTSLELQLARLKYVKCKSNSKMQKAEFAKLVNDRIYNCEIGLRSEKKIETALLTFSPVSKIIRDICFTLDGKFYQIDFLLITPIMIFMIDSKSSFCPNGKHTAEEFEGLKKQEEALKKIVKNGSVNNDDDIISRVCPMIVYTEDSHGKNSNYDSSIKDKYVHIDELFNAVTRLNAVKTSMYERLDVKQMNFISEAISEFCIQNPTKKICPVCNKEMSLQTNRTNKVEFLNCPECEYTANLNFDELLIGFLNKDSVSGNS